MNSIPSAVFGPIFGAIFWMLKVYKWILIIGIFLSWVRPDPYNPIVRFIYSITEPVFAQARRLLPFLRIGMIDLSPIAVFVFIEIIMRLLVIVASYIV